MPFPPKHQQKAVAQSTPGQVMQKAFPHLPAGMEAEQDFAFCWSHKGCSGGRDHFAFAVSVLSAAATESFALQIIQNMAFLGNIIHLHGCGAELTNFCSLFSRV